MIATFQLATGRYATRLPTGKAKWPLRRAHSMLYDPPGGEQTSRPMPTFQQNRAPNHRNRKGIRIPSPIPNLVGQSVYTPELSIDGTKLMMSVSNLDSNVVTHYVDIPRTWLRDNCACSSCRNQDTGQRQINVFKDNVDASIAKIESSDGGDIIKITFGDGHVSKFTKAFILDRKNSATNAKRHGVVPITTWDASIASEPPTVPFSSLEHDGLGPLLKKIREFGFCFVKGTPATPEATESLLSAIGPIRNTHYGGFYDFTADLSSKDTAYTSESLEPHTDNTYFTEPTGLQALHLLSHTEGTGGESSLVDGFDAAEKIYEQCYPEYVQLAMTKVFAHASGNQGISIQPAHGVPVFSLDPERQHLMQVRWNNADRAGIERSFAKMGKWYAAAGKFDAVISDPKNQYWFQLTPGKLLIFDNWRVLHGRSAFTGKRRMCGGYINRDDFISKYRQTNMSAEDIRASTVTG